MTARQRARTAAGLLTLTTLLVLIVVDTIHPTVTLTLEYKALLVSATSALLGVDIWRSSNLPVEVKLGRGSDSQGDDPD